MPSRGDSGSSCVGRTAKAQDRLGARGSVLQIEDMKTPAPTRAGKMSLARACSVLPRRFEVAGEHHGISPRRAARATRPAGGWVAEPQVHPPVQGCNRAPSRSKARAGTRARVSARENRLVGPHRPSTSCSTSRVSHLAHPSSENPCLQTQEAWSHTSRPPSTQLVRTRLAARSHAPAFDGEPAEPGLDPWPARSRATRGFLPLGGRAESTILEVERVGP